MIPKWFSKWRPGEIAPDRRGWFYSSLSANLWQIYFLTGFLSDLGEWTHLNNVFLALFVAAAAFTKRLTLSPLIVFYGALTALSLANHLALSGQFGLPAEARLMPLALIATIASRSLAEPGLFVRGVALNCLPLIALMLIGGVTISFGRFSSPLLRESLHGILPYMAIAIGLGLLLQRRSNWLLTVAFLGAIVFVALGASRKYLLFLILAAPVLLFSMRHHFNWRVIVRASAFILVALLVLAPLMIDSMQKRFGGEFHLTEHVESLFSRDASDPSSTLRLGLIDVTLQALREHPFGFGQANFLSMARRYAPELPDANNPHAGILDALAAGGYPGLVIYLAMIGYLILIGRKDLGLRLTSLWLLIQIISQAHLASKLLWPLLAVAERELELSKKLGGSRLVRLQPIAPPDSPGPPA